MTAECRHCGAKLTRDDPSEPWRDDRMSSGCSVKFYHQPAKGTIR